MKTYKLFIIILLCIAIIIPQTACTEKEKAPVSENGFYLDTLCSITLYDMEKDDAHRLISDAFELCSNYESLLSRTVRDSDIYNLNHSSGQPSEISDETAQLMEKGLYYGDLSKGKFDITVGRLSSLWNFKDENPSVPASQDIAEALQTVDYKKLHLESEGNPETKSQITARLDDPGAQVDLGGIAKGYIADRITDFLMEQGVERAIVNLGGNIAAIGEKSDGSSWNIGIEKPFSDRKEIVGSISIKNKTVVTSGIYERKFEENGILYHHILDSSTGYPVETDLESVTLVADIGRSADCDALSTICLMSGTDEGLALIESIDGIEAAFINLEGDISLTSGMEFNPTK